MTVGSYEIGLWSTDWSTDLLPNPIEASESRTRARSSASRKGFALWAS